MFAKRQSTLAAAAGTPPRQRGRVSLKSVFELVKKPPVIAGLAGVFLLSSSALFLTVLGDPRAGAPSARTSLERTVPEAPAAPTGFDAFSAGAMGLYQNLMGGDPASSALEGGEALITLPDGASVAGGGASYTVPVHTASPLAPAPMAGMHQPGPNGPMPRIAPDGRTPAQVYARPFSSNGKPRVALIVGGLGLNAATTRAAIERLPPEVTLSFVPYADNLQAWIDQARAQGHEVMLEMPMEPTGYPNNDPGPYTLLAEGGPEDVAGRLDWLLSRATGYFGVTNYLGDRFATSDTGVGAFLGTLRNHGVSFIDDGTFRRRQGAWARGSADRVIDESQSPAAIIAALNSLEAQAKIRGAALGTGFSYPVTVEAVARWTAGLDQRGLQLAPASAMTQRAGR